jgi:glycerol-3-phosphate dehydrogenase
MGNSTVDNNLLERSAILARLEQVALWDVLIIGGGATGLGTALDAASRGYSVLLLEQSDFAKGTSSRSTKLVHGGVRYLAQGDVRLVREASVERGLLNRNAPHLVRNQTFIIPIYTWFDRIKYTIGLKLYDWIAGRLSLGSSNFISRKETLEQLPGIKTKGLLGGVVYHDGQFDDARLALNLAQTLHEQGGLALNYCKVSALLKDQAGNVAGVEARELETGRQFSIHAKAVINATGVFADDILQMDNPSAPKSIRPSQGVHLVVDKSFYPSEHALMIPATSDGRVLFAVPWHEKVVLGTTDTPIDHASQEPVALEKEIQFILDTATQYLSKAPQRSDVLSVFAGLRPLAAPKDGQTKTKEISRSHKIEVTQSGLFSISGGKWTTYRRMGQDLMDEVEKVKNWPGKKSGTASLPIHGFKETANWNDPLFYYGSDSAIIKQQIERQPNGWLSKEYALHEVQVRWAVQHEMARTVEDVLARRARILFLDAKVASALAAPVASVMADELHKDRQWQEEQTASFKKLADNYRLSLAHTVGAN